MRCELVQRHMGALVDGELDPATHIEFERHIDVCADCQELMALDEMIRGELRSQAAQTEVPQSLEERVRLAIAQAELRPPSESSRPMVSVVPLRMRQAVPLAAAAALFLVVGGVAVTDGENVQSAGLLEDVVHLHTRQLPSDVQEPEPTRVSQYFRDKVEFPVRPARFDRQDARLVGARLSNVRDRRAAALYYDVHGRRVTVVVFPAEGMAPSQGAQRMRFGGSEIMFRTVSGYSVPIREYDGLAYAFTGDLARDDLFRLAASARVVY